MKQTLETLFLSNNDIGEKGTQYLGEALQTNTVRVKQTLLSILCWYLIQTLTTLNINNNQIGESGAQYLGAALQTNTVREKQPL